MQVENKRVVFQRIYYYMEKKGMNISQLAESLGVPQQRASYMLNVEKNGLSIETIEQMARVFDTTLLEMLTPLPPGIKVRSPDGRRKKE
ncbi:MAG: helix-turn-helix transcriptional regulator [Erysipelotrichaceae bacterium]